MDIYWPAQNFITVSVTGQECELMCQHCQGRFLKQMEPANTPEKLWKLALELKPGGMLISGGSDSKGAVPILPYLDIIKNIKEDLNISINLHTGLIDIDDIPKLAGRGIDVISFDVIGSSEAMKNVYGLEVEPDYFDRALSEFNKSELKAVPHITVGLDAGNDSGEIEALKIIARHEPDFVVLNALMSSEGAEKSAERLIEILPLARDILPENTAIGIGCMRPRGDLLNASQIVESGISSIALPSKNLIQELRSLGIDITEKDGCCAFY